MKRMNLCVEDPTGMQVLRPVTGGVPIASGKAPRGSTFVLHDDQGRSVPLQSSVLRRWNDGSAQWVLLDLLTTGTQNLVLSWTKNAKAIKPDQPVTVCRGKRPSLRTGAVTAELAENGVLTLSDRLEVVLTLTNHRGQHCRGVVESTETETTGPIRSSMVLTGAFYTTGCERIFGFRLRVTMFAGSRKVRLEPMILIDADKGMMHKIRELKLHVRPRSSIATGSIGGEPSWQGKISARAHVRMFQRDDAQYSFQGVRGKGRRAPGWAEFNDEIGTIAVAMREFWQRWPKGIEISRQGMTMEIFPRIQAGRYKHMEPWYKYQYLFDGTCYRLRTGQTRRWEIWIDLDGNGAELAEFTNVPPVLAPEPAQALATGLWGNLAPAGGAGMREYDKWADNLFKEYLACAEKQRDYGEMNWGDWFGERHVNWGNHEYDTSNVILSQFARTGDPRYFYAGCAAGRHTSEVDTIHFVNDDLKDYFESNFGNPNYPIRAGMMHEHCVGHVGGFYSIERIRRLLASFDVRAGVKKPYLCLDPYNLGHVFTQGMARLYFLTGDPWLKETVLAVGDNLAKLVLDRKFGGFKDSTHSGRVNGWTMLALAPALEITPARTYLRAMKTLADDALSEQDPDSGGWLYDLTHGHCYCTTRKHVGEAGFIGCVRMNGLCRYYQLTGDKRIPVAMKRYIDYLINDTWDERRRDWRYTSCPASKYINQIGVTIMAMVYSARITGDIEHIRVLKDAWSDKFDRLKRVVNDPGSLSQGAGKMYSLNMYGSSEAAALFAENSEKE